MYHYSKYKMQNLEKAKKHYKIVLSCKGDIMLKISAYYNLGSIYSKQGDKKTAIGYFKAIVEFPESNSKQIKELKQIATLDLAEICKNQRKKTQFKVFKIIKDNDPINLKNLNKEVLWINDPINQKKLKKEALWFGDYDNKSTPEQTLQDYKKLNTNLIQIKKRFTCATCKKTAYKGMKKCSRCKTTYYCSRDCQGQDWKQHKLTCKKK